MTAAIKQIGSIGERMDLLVRQGGTLGPFTATMMNPDGTPVNLTGCQIRGQIRQTASSPTVTANLDVASPYDDTGSYTFSLAATVTAGIAAGADVNQPASQYVWDLELVDALGRVTPLYWGVVKVHREVTRA